MYGEKYIVCVYFASIADIRVNETLKVVNCV
jgi:hypothetical protein